MVLRADGFPLADLGFMVPQCGKKSSIRFLNSEAREWEERHRSLGMAFTYAPRRDIPKELQRTTAEGGCWKGDASDGTDAMRESLENPPTGAHGPLWANVRNRRKDRAVNASLDIRPPPPSAEIATSEACAGPFPRGSILGPMAVRDDAGVIRSYARFRFLKSNVSRG